MGIRRYSLLLVVSATVMVGNAFAQTNTYQSGGLGFLPSSGTGSWFWIDNPGASGNYLRISNGNAPGDAGSVVINSAGNVGIGTGSPISALTLAGAGTLNPNTGPQLDYPGENLTFLNTNGGFELGGIRMVQPTGNYVDRGNMVFTVGVGGGGGNLLDAVTIQAPTGNVGIGTMNPGSPLEVKGNITLTAKQGGSIIFQDGSTQNVAWNGLLQGGDYAESVDVSGDRAQYAPGDVLVVDPAAEGRFLKSSQPYSTTVMGIYSTRPGVVGRRQKSDRSHMAEEVPMAMIGVVPTKVSAEGGPIKPGDLLVTSSTPGYAMKGTDHNQMMGAIIGKALGHLDSGTGLIEVAVSLQ